MFSPYGPPLQRTWLATFRLRSKAFGSRMTIFACVRCVLGVLGKSVIPGDLTSACNDRFVNYRRRAGE